MEYVVLVDEQNNYRGLADKASVHHKDTPLHRGFSLFLFNELGDLLLQQRAFTKKTWPGVWSNSVCGHPKLNETSVQAAARRLSDELGMGAEHVYEIDSTFRYRAQLDGIVENELCPILIGFSTQHPKPNPAEVHATRWMPWQNWLDQTQLPNHYSPWSVLETDRLKSSARFIELYKQHTQ